MKLAILFCYAFVIGTALPMIFAPAFPAWQVKFAGIALMHWLLFFSFLTALSAFLLYRKKNNSAFFMDEETQIRTSRRIFFCSLLLALSSLLLASANYYRAVNTSSPSHILNYVDQNISDRTLLRGTIIRDPDDRGVHTLIDIQPEEIVKFSKTEFETDPAVPQVEFRTKVERVIDGDTVEIFESPPSWLLPNARSGRSVRLLGINAPEIPHAQYNPQESMIGAAPGGEEAKAFLKKLVEGKSVVLKIAKSEPQDNYGRWLALIYLPGKKESLSEIMLQKNLAQIYFLSSEGFVHLKQNPPVKLSGKTGYVRAKVLPEIGEELYASLAYGQRVEIASALLLPRPQTNPAGFDYSEYLLARNIYATTLPIKKSEQIKIVGKSEMNPLVALSFQLKKKILAVIRETMPYPESAFLGGVTFGWRGGVPADVKAEFQATGIAWVLAVAGLHVGYVAAFLWILSKLFRVPRKASFFFVLFGVVIYAIITGASAATRRATLMLAIGQYFYTFRAAGFRASAVLTIPIAAFVILLFDPLLLPDASFVLSFLAVWSLVYISHPIESLFRKNSFTRGCLFFPYFFLLVSLTAISIFSIAGQVEFLKRLSSFFRKIPLMHEWLPDYRLLLGGGYAVGVILYFLFRWLKKSDLIETIYRQRRQGVLRGLMDFTCAQLAILIGMMWPLSSVYFQRFPIAGSFANFLVIPLLSVIVQYGLMVAGVKLVLTAIGLKWLGLKLALSIQAFNWVISEGFLGLAKNWANFVPYPYVETMNPATLFFYYGVVLVFIFHAKILSGLQKIYYRLGISLKPGPLFRWALSTVLVAIFAFAALFSYLKRRPQKLSLTFFDCGQGNAILIHTPNKKAILIDGGWGALRSPGDEESEEEPAPFLAASAGGESLGRKEKRPATAGGWDFGESGIATALSKYEIQSLDLLVNTSPRAGNLSALSYVLNHFPVREVVIPYATGTILTKGKKLVNYGEFLQVSGLKNVSYMDASGAEEKLDQPDRFEPYLKEALGVYGEILQKQNLKVRSARAGEIIYRESVAGKNLVITVLHPKGEVKEGRRTYQKGDDPIGSRTLVLKVLYGDFSCLIPTQISRKTIETLVKQKREKLRADLLLLPKNGHPFWNPEEFLKSVQPKAGIVQYGVLPRTQSRYAATRIKDWYLFTTEKMLKKNKIVGYRTDQLGAIIVQSDGSPLNEQRDIRWILKDKKPGENVREDVGEKLNVGL